MTSTRPRIFVAELDSVATRRLYSDYQLSDVDVEARLVGALRLAHLVGGEILVTDAMLFDSRFFAELEPGELATLLGASPQRLPLAVLHREPTLGEALEAKIARGPGFRWQLAGPPLRRTGSARTCEPPGRGGSVPPNAGRSAASPC